jgi:hypothetical protein
VSRTPGVCETDTKEFAIRGRLPFLWFSKISNPRKHVERRDPRGPHFCWSLVTYGPHSGGAGRTLNHLVGYEVSLAAKLLGRLVFASWRPNVAAVPPFCSSANPALDQYNWYLGALGLFWAIDSSDKAFFNRLGLFCYKEQNASPM